jgi:predicted nucleic acid-binding protein
MKYILDTNVISDMLNQQTSVIQRVEQALLQDTLYLCQPVYFELRRGLLWKQASRGTVVGDSGERRQATERY